MKKDLEVGYTIGGNRVNRVVQVFDGPEWATKCAYCASGRKNCYCEKLLCHADERSDNQEVYWMAF